MTTITAKKSRCSRFNKFAGVAVRPHTAAASGGANRRRVGHRAAKKCKGVCGCGLGANNGLRRIELYSADPPPRRCVRPTKKERGRPAGRPLGLLVPHSPEWSHHEAIFSAKCGRARAIEVPEVIFSSLCYACNSRPVGPVVRICGPQGIQLSIKREAAVAIARKLGRFRH